MFKILPPVPFCSMCQPASCEGEHSAVQVHGASVHHRIPWESRQAPSNHSGVVHKNVDGTKLRDCFFDKTGVHLRIRKISGKIESLAGPLQEFGTWRTRSDPARGNPRLRRLCKSHSDCGAKSSVRSRHEGILAVQLEGSRLIDSLFPEFAQE